MSLQKDRKEGRWERKGLEREREERAVFEEVVLLLSLRDGHLTEHVPTCIHHIVPLEIKTITFRSNAATLEELT